MNTKIDKLKPRHELLASILAKGTSIRDAAAEMGVAPSTVYRLARNPEVKARTREIQSEIAGAAVAVLKSSIRSAVEILSSLAEDETVPPQVRCSAAGQLLDSGIKAIETAEILGRLEALEKTMIEED